MSKLDFCIDQKSIQLTSPTIERFISTPSYYRIFSTLYRQGIQ